MAKTGESHSAFIEGKRSASLEVHWRGCQDNTYGQDNREIPTDSSEGIPVSRERLGSFVSDGDKKP